ncbi:hypothetical protein OUZ56_018699 [Daphnia magna]|uniref:Uncharacterized protein n=1 Tax=Daphnia magna TaxID=35525 RepID=A0ABQ9ZAP2_9CRUS|nr:hypothetical protein OUZ56_018699 [Daphnia magna]
MGDFSRKTLPLVRGQLPWKSMSYHYVLDEEFCELSGRGIRQGPVFYSFRKLSPESLLVPGAQPWVHHEPMTMPPSDVPVAHKADQTPART